MDISVAESDLSSGKMAHMPPSLPPSKPNLPWKLNLICGFSSFISACATVLRSDFTLLFRLLKLFDRKTLPSSDPIDGVSSFDVNIDPSRDLWVRIYTPVRSPEVASNGMAVIVYYHGGGFILGSAGSRNTNAIARRYAGECSAVVVSVNYRLAPEHRFPCQYEDGFDALKFIDGLEDEAFTLGADRSRCFLAGDSAGGNLAHHVAVEASQYVFRRVNLKGIIAVQPFFGGEDRTESELHLGCCQILTLKISDCFWKAFLPVGSDRDHSASNVFGPNGVDLSGLKFPPTLIIVGGFDPLQDGNRNYYENLIKFGKEAELVEYPTAIHGFNAFQELPESSLFFETARDFVRKHMA